MSACPCYGVATPLAATSHGCDTRGTWTAPTPRATVLRLREARMPSRTWDRALVAAAVLCLLAAPWSWVDDGVTPSWVVFPLFVAVGLWRLLKRDRGRVWLAVTAAVFLVVHVPWVVAAVSGDENPLDADAPFNPEQWLVTLLVLPLLLAVTAVLARRARRRDPSAAAGT